MTRLSFSTLFSLLALASTSLAWEGHSSLRRLAIEKMEALRALPAVPVTPMVEAPQGINPKAKFEFRGAKPGETQTPYEILVTYAQEPDWGMDQELNASWQQRFMGGYTGLSSQGYFHMYYPVLTLHLPFPVLSMGAAPKRAEQWAGMSERAFANGHDYWGWRFFAWSLHYVEDLAQPFHSTQTHRKFVRLRSPIQGTTNCTANFHLLYEHWLSERIVEEASGQGELGLSEALEAGGPFAPGRSVEDTIVRVAKASHKGFGQLAELLIQYFGERFVSSDRVEPTEEELKRMQPGETLDQILAISRSRLQLAGSALRTLIEQVLEREAQRSRTRGASAPNL